MEPLNAPKVLSVAFFPGAPAFFVGWDDPTQPEGEQRRATAVLCENPTLTYGKKPVSVSDLISTLLFTPSRAVFYPSAVYHGMCETAEFFPLPEPKA